MQVCFIGILPVVKSKVTPDSVYASVSETLHGSTILGRNYMSILVYICKMKNSKGLAWENKKHI